MVRRLSFINDFNKTRTYTFNTRRHSHTDVCMNTVFYVRKPFTFRFITKHRRKTWRRRKHLFEYVLYLNILSLWATEYTFFRKIVKFNYTYCITKTSLFVYNLAMLRSTSPAVAKNSEFSYLATLSKTSLKYFWKFNWKTYQFWQQSLNTPIVISSFFINANTDDLYKTCMISVGLQYTTSTLTSYTTELTTNHIESFHSLLDNVWTDYIYLFLVEIYKLQILLIINKTF